MKFKCIKAYSGDKEIYGVDFLEGRTYQGKQDGADFYRLESTENGTSVLLSTQEVEEYFVKTN